MIFSQVATVKKKTNSSKYTVINGSLACKTHGLPYRTATAHIQVSDYTQHTWSSPLATESKMTTTRSWLCTNISKPSWKSVFTYKRKMSFKDQGKPTRRTHIRNELKHCLTRPLTDLFLLSLVMSGCPEELKIVLTTD